MTTQQNVIPMAMMQPNPQNIVENLYEAGEAVLPKQDGEFTFFMLMPIFTKDSTPFRPDNAGPTKWDTDHFIPGREAPGPCVVLWSKVVRRGSEQKILSPKTPPLIT